MNPIITALFPIIGKILDRVIPDKAQAAQAQLDTLKLFQSAASEELQADVQLALAQINVNNTEASSPDFFRGGWRPAVGWICAFALGYQMILRPLLAWVSSIESWMPPPSLELDTLMTLLFGLLGLGAMRTVEKIKAGP